jgi:hypothetical protein
MYLRHCIFLYDKYQQSALTMCVEVPKKRLFFAMLVCLALCISPLQLNELNVSDDRPSRGSSTIQVFVGYHWLPKYVVIDALAPMQEGACHSGIGLVPDSSVRRLDSYPFSSSSDRPLVQKLRRNSKPF